MTTHPHRDGDDTEHEQDRNRTDPTLIDTDTSMSDTTDHPDDHDRDDTEPQDHTEKYTKTSRTRIAPPGKETLEESTEESDLEGMGKVQETKVSSCNCGATHLDFEKTYTCARCEERACIDCHIRQSRRHYCPDCAVRKWRLDKSVYESLYLLDNELTTVEDLLVDKTVDDQPVELQIDPTTATLLEEGYIHIPGSRNNSPIRLSEDDALTVSGREALKVGEQLYSDDPDIQEMKDRVQIIKAADSGR